MLNRAERLYCSISAMMVCCQQTIVGDNLCRAAAAVKGNYCILERGVVYVVYLLCGEFATGTLHLLYVEFFQKGQQPHSLICSKLLTAKQDCSNQ